MSRTKLGLTMMLILVSAALAQNWVLGPTGQNVLATRFDGEYFPGTGKVYFLGGRLADASTVGTIWAYDPATQTYATTGASMPTPVSNYEVALLRDNYDLMQGDTYGLYTFGGRDNAGAFISTVQVYYPRTNRVVTVTSDPYPNNTGGIYYIPCSNPVANNKAYVMGGFQSSATPYLSNAVYIYDPLASAGSRWTLSPYPLINARGYIIGAVVDSFLYACGGNTFDGTNLYTQSYVERFNLNTPGAWTAVASMLVTNGETKGFGFGTGTPYYRTAPGDLARKIVIAGRSNWPAEDSACYIYDVATNAWSSFPVLRRACRNMAGAFIPGTAMTNGRPGIWLWGGRHTSDLIVGDTCQYFPLQVPQNSDVGATKIEAPTGTVDSGTSVTPSCSVYNYGSTTTTYYVRMKIGAGYNASAQIAAHVPGAFRWTTFPIYTSPYVGTFPVTCSTELTGDIAPANDKVSGSVTVRSLATIDVGCTRLIAPLGTIDSGVAVTPACSVYNYGSAAATYNVRLKTGTGFNVTTLVTAHPAGTRQYVTFAPWTPAVRGGVAISCSTELTSDGVTGNDKQTGTVTIAVHDVSAELILAPIGSVAPGPVTPSATVHNYGTSREPVTVTFSIAPAGYAQTLTFSSGLPLATDTLIDFPSWTAVNGSYTTRCSVYLATDQHWNNNVATGSFTVGSANIDAGVTQILSPNNNVDSAATVTPSIRVRNYGDDAATFDCIFTIDDGTDIPVYVDTATVTSLAPNGQATVDFAVWPKPHALGNYTGFAQTVLTGDGNAVNDTLRGAFSIIVGAPPVDTGWLKMTDVPTGPKSKRVKDGGCITEGKDGTGDLMYALKGGNTFEFYAYNIDGNTWTSRESIPAIGRAGKKKGVKKGAGLAYDKWNEKVYATKANNTWEFWCYDITTGKWAQKADLPVGSGKGIKEGSDIVLRKQGSDYKVYLLKGTNSTDFYAYDVATDVWTTMANAPVGVSGKNFKDGSCLGDDGEFIYALKGGYNEYYAYNPDDNTWATRKPMPLIGSLGKKKKAKSGASLVEARDAIWALKGGNTLEFWKYVSDTWVQKPDVPLGAGKRVKGGGGLATHGNAVFALKGNNTLEFYRYGIPTTGSLFGTPTSQSTQSSLFNLQSSIFNLRATPNPFSSATTINFSLARPGTIRLELYDVTGKLVTTITDDYRTAGTHSSSLPNPNLVSGIYLLKLTTPDGSAAQKLIVE